MLSRRVSPYSSETTSSCFSGSSFPDTISHIFSGFPDALITCLGLIIQVFLCFSWNTFLYFSKLHVFVSVASSFSIYLYMVSFGIPFWLPGFLCLGFRTVNPSLITSSLYHALMHCFFRCIELFPQFLLLRHNSLTVLSVLCCADHRAWTLEYWKSMSFHSSGHMPLSCTVLDTPTD